MCKATEYCCPDAKHCLTPTAKVCGATAKCAADETCCPLTKVRSLSIVRGAVRLSREVARPSLTTGLALVAALRQGRRRLQVPVRRPEVLLLPVRPHSPSRQKHPQRKRKAELVRKQGRQALPDAGQPWPPVHRGRRGRRQVRGRRGLLPAHQGAPNLLHQKHSHNRLITPISSSCRSASRSEPSAPRRHSRPPCGSEAPGCSASALRAARDTKL